MSTLYEYVEGQLTVLIPKFALTQSEYTVRHAYEIICRESLAMPLSRKPPDFSRINVDGTPFQFSLSLGPDPSPLQFLSEVGVVGSSNADRMALSKKRINALSTLLHIGKPMSSADSILAQVAPKGDPELMANPSGVFWISVSFLASSSPKLRIYINDKWGSEKGMWTRLDSFASYFNAADRWKEIKKLLIGEMNPLGMALTLSEDRLTSGRIYVSAYGKPAAYYERLIRSTVNEESVSIFRQFTETLLEEERQYPTKSAVCSFEFSSQGEPDFKFELCGHCIFESDSEASEKCLKWLEYANADVTPYKSMLGVISEGNISKTNNDLHCYIGFGLRQGNIYSTIYLKPNIFRPREER